jgi:putative ABC transport system permease protein
MNKLNRMLIREILKSKGQFIAAVAVVFAGIAMFSASFVSYKNLKNSVDNYYEQYAFLNYYADVKGISSIGISEINAIKGVKGAIGRITADVGADMGSDKRVTVRLISMPEVAQPDVNRLVSISGAYFNNNDQYSCLVSRKFAEFYKLEENSSIKAIINLKTYEFNVDGIVDSPEFVYAMKSPSDVSPSAEKFGIVYVKESTAASILGTNNMYNQVHVAFEKNTEEAELIDILEDNLKPYGFIIGTERKDQLSSLMVDNEIAELSEIALMFPMLFLTVAATIIYIMQRRIINNQRTLIGVMKAIGYTNSRILMHYILYSLLIALAGAIPGVFVGFLLSIALTKSYTNIFSIPLMKTEIYMSLLALGVLMSSGFCLLAGYSSAKRVLKIDPAQAMRSEAPSSGKRVFLERVGFIWNRLAFGWKMSIRNVFRSRTRTLFTIVGMMATIMFFLVSLFFLDSIDYILYQNFFVFQKQDYKITFAKPSSYYDALELRSIEGIRKVEPVLEIPVEIQNGWRKEETFAVGVIEENDFYRLIDDNFTPVKVPEEGMLIAQTIAEKLDIKKGDMVKVKLYLGDIFEKDIKDAGLVKQYAGFNCYMNIKELGRLAEEGAFATGALASVKAGKDEAVIKELYDISGIETVEARNDVFKDFATFLELMNMFVGFMIFFGTIMGFSIIFNTTVINIMERRRELASLKVLGYTSKEVENTISRENMMIGVISIIPGVLFGEFMCNLLAKMFSNEVFAFEVVISPKTYLIAILSVFLFAVLAQNANKKNISGLDMVEVLKNREN